MLYTRPVRSGKSTLLNMMAGLEKPTKGNILVKGHDITKMNEKKACETETTSRGFHFSVLQFIIIIDSC